MSLHAQLSPEAQKRLADQQRNSTLTSIIIALLTVLLLALIFMRFFLKPSDDTAAFIETYVGRSFDKPKYEKPKGARAIKPKPAAPSNMASKLLFSQKRSNISIPVVSVDVPSPSAGFGVGGEGLGNGNVFGEGENGNPYDGIPDDLRERCSKADRLARLSNNGGNERCEDAVVNSLRWLQKTQNKDGSWCGDNKVAMTGFALLAYLGHCETPNSEEFGDTVTRAIIYLTNVSIKNNGKMADDFKDRHWCYDHGIATYALAEAVTFCMNLDIHIPQLREAVKMSGDWILENQHSSGSWDYAYDQSGKRGGDNSIGLWHIQALKACKHTGLWGKRAFASSIRSALGYIKSSQASDGGIGYAGPRPHKEKGYTMTGGGMLAFQMWGKGHDVLVRNGARYIKNHAKFDYNTSDSDLYRHYYHAQAMMNRGGAEWVFYNNLFRDQLLKNQNVDGSWKNVGGGSKVNGVAAQYQGASAKAEHYRTCLATLMLEVYYRFLPATGAR